MGRLCPRNLRVGGWRHSPGSSHQALPPCIAKYMAFVGPSSQMAHLTITHSFQLLPSLASVQWWSAQCPWGAGCPARRPWRWPHTLSCSSSAQVLPRPRPSFPEVSLSEIVPRLWLPEEGGESLWSVLGGPTAPIRPLPRAPPPGPQPPHLPLCRRLRVHSCPGSGVSAGRTQLCRGALWHHGPAHRTPGAERPRAAH